MNEFLFLAQKRLSAIMVQMKLLAMNWMTNCWQAGQICFACGSVLQTVGTACTLHK